MVDFAQFYLLHLDRLSKTTTTGTVVNDSGLQTRNMLPQRPCKRI